jgi:uncharacterized protein YecE (DUF72 family)
VIGRSIGFKPVRTGPLGYVRLHGRNYRAWFAKDKAEASARYDYLYTPAEVEEIAGVARAVAAGAGETYVVQNNHPRGQAIANAAQVRASLGEALRDLPDALFIQYPFLKPLAGRN